MKIEGVVIATVITDCKVSCIVDIAGGHVEIPLDPREAWQ